MVNVGMSAASNLKDLPAGMSDAELELACNSKSTGISSWSHWTSEIYSFGKCFRYWTKYPRLLPLFVYSDHGVGLHSQLFPHELENSAKVHLTWHPMKEQRYKNFGNKKVIQIIHPWISYRQLKGRTRSINHSGTLVFYAHGTSEVKFVGHDTEEYFEELRKLPDKFQPVVLCLHMLDIKAGIHKKLRRHGFPIVTAGNTSAVDFVDHFYTLVKNYSYATSQAWGSNVAYCVELGVPYFFLGDRPDLVNISDQNLPEGVVPQYWDNYHEELGKKAEALFSMPVDTVTNEQRAFVESILGLNSQLTLEQVSWILWREFFRNCWKLPMVWLRVPIRNILEKLGLLGVSKKIIRSFKSNKSNSKRANGNTGD
jgi:hypothetical protein